MARYFFHLCDGRDALIDPEGRELVEAAMIAGAALKEAHRVIVETQKVVLEELRAELRELAATHEQQRVELLAQVRRWRTRSEATQAGTDTRERLP